jgi:signal transduction histidine kinase/ActR/RegA family two-component response regulator
VQHDARVSDREWARREGIVAFAGYPLLIEEKLVGVLAMFARKPLTDFTLKALESVSGNVALGIRRKQAERAEETMRQQLMQAQKMEAVGRLAGGVAHDFNNILTAVIGYCDFALDQLREEDPLYRDIGEVKKAGVRASGLTRQLLAFSRKQVLEPRPVDLNEVATGLEKMLRRLIGEDIDLKLALAPALGTVMADPGQVEQVLLNLVVNARDAMPKGGKVTIETENALLDEAYADAHPDVRPGPYAAIAVSDTGCGMAREVLAHLFEPFFTTKETGKGTGLGLSTAYGIVKQSGGHISVYSEPGKGSTFRVFLPRTDRETVTEKKDPSPVALRGTETVLVVEDDEVIRTIASRMLRAHGYTVLTAPDGDSALTVCGRSDAPVDLLLTDVVMPRMGGRDLADRLAALHPALRVLYMSGYTAGAIADHGVLEAGVALLQKPFAAEPLLRKVRQVLDGVTARGGLS